LILKLRPVQVLKMPLGAKFEISPFMYLYLLIAMANSPSIAISETIGINHETERHEHKLLGNWEEGKKDRNKGSRSAT